MASFIDSIVAQIAKRADFGTGLTPPRALSDMPQVSPGSETGVADDTAMQPADDPDDASRRMEADHLLPQAKPPMPLGTVAHAKLASSAVWNTAGDTPGRREMGLTTMPRPSGFGEGFSNDAEAMRRLQADAAVRPAPRPLSPAEQQSARGPLRGAEPASEPSALSRAMMGAQPGLNSFVDMVRGKTPSLTAGLADAGGMYNLHSLFGKKSAAVPLGAQLPWSPPAAPSSPSPMPPPQEITTSNDPQKPLAVAVPKVPGGPPGPSALINATFGDQGCRTEAARGSAVNRQIAVARQEVASGVGRAGETAGNIGGRPQNVVTGVGFQGTPLASRRGGVHHRHDARFDRIGQIGPVGADKIEVGTTCRTTCASGDLP